MLLGNYVPLGQLPTPLPMHDATCAYASATYAIPAPGAPSLSWVNRYLHLYLCLPHLPLPYLSKVVIGWVIGERENLCFRNLRISPQLKL